MEITLVLLLLLITMILFSLEKISFDVVVVFDIIILVSLRIINTKEAFAGFSNDFIVMLAAIFLIGSSLQHNGIIDHLSEKLIRVKKINVYVLLLVIMVSVGILSAFMNNTTIAAIFIAPVISVCRKFDISPSKMLMPMAFASLMGGTCTLVGTSTNIAGSAFMQEYGIDPLTMFELLPLGLAILVSGIIYMLVVGVHLLPDNKKYFQPLQEQERTYNAEVVVTAESALFNKSIEQVEKEANNLELIRIYRKNNPEDESLLYEKDVLLLRGSKKNLLMFRSEQNVQIKKSQEHENDKDMKVAEIMVLPTSFHLNTTLGKNYFQQQNRVSILAVHRKNELINERIKDIQVRTGDILLTEGKQENLDLIRERSNFVIISETAKTNIASLRKGWLTLLFFVIAIILGTLNILPLSIAFMLTAVLVVIIKAIPGDRLYNSIDWRLLILIGGMAAFGTALQNTGADVFIANKVITLLAPHGKYAVLIGFMLLTVVLTQPMSNAAAALVILPIAIQTAQIMHLPVRPFCIAIIASASISMIAPFEPCSILVFTPGKYKIADFIKVGGIFTIIALAVILWLVPTIWGF